MTALLIGVAVVLVRDLRPTQWWSMRGHD